MRGGGGVRIWNGEEREKEQATVLVFPHKQASTSRSE